jgi:hypothetical protein
VAPRLQGILLTAEALGFFVAAMMLFPHLRMTSAAPEPVGPVAAGPATGTP